LGLLSGTKLTLDKVPIRKIRRFACTLVLCVQFGELGGFSQTRFLGFAGCLVEAYGLIHFERYQVDKTRDPPVL